MDVYKQLQSTHPWKQLRRKLMLRCRSLPKLLMLSRPSLRLSTQVATRPLLSCLASHDFPVMKNVVRFFHFFPPKHLMLSRHPCVGIAGSTMSISLRLSHKMDVFISSPSTLLFLEIFNLSYLFWSLPGAI